MTAARPRGPTVARRRHRLPDRHRAHLHGRRGARGRRRGAPASTIHVETQGSAGSHAARPRDDRQRRRRDLRRRRGRPRPRPVRRQADGQLRRQARDRRRRRDDRRGAAATPTTRTAPRVEGTAAEAGAAARPGSESCGAGRVRRVLMTGVSLHDPVRRGRRSAHRAGLPARRLRDRRRPRRRGDRRSTTTRRSTCPTCPTTSGSTHALFDGALLAYLGAVLFTARAAPRSASWCPALAGYIAYAIADRPGIAPGFVMGAIAGTLERRLPRRHRRRRARRPGRATGSPAGRCPTWVRGLMPVLVIPLLATLIAGFVMVVVLGKPLAGLMDGAAATGSTACSGGSAILLGIILGLMMAFDMGGPLNKTAYAFATAGLGAAATATDAPELKIMAAVMLAGMVPPLALALATVRPPQALHRRRARERQGRVAARAPRSSPRAPSRSPRPTRCASSRRSWSGSAVTGASVDGLRRRAARPARRHLRALRRRRRRWASSSPWSPARSSPPRW